MRDSRAGIDTRIASAITTSKWLPIPTVRHNHSQPHQTRQRNGAECTLARRKPGCKHGKMPTVPIDDDFDKRHSVSACEETKQAPAKWQDFLNRHRHRRQRGVLSIDTVLTHRGRSYRVYVQSRGAGLQRGLPTGSDNRWPANRGVRRSYGSRKGPEGEATSVAGRRCGGASSRGGAR